MDNHYSSLENTVRGANTGNSSRKRAGILPRLGLAASLLYTSACASLGGSADGFGYDVFAQAGPTLVPVSALLQEKSQEKPLPKDDGRGLGAQSNIELKPGDYLFTNRGQSSDNFWLGAGITTAVVGGIIALGVTDYNSDNFNVIYYPDSDRKARGGEGGRGPGGNPN